MTQLRTDSGRWVLGQPIVGQRPSVDSSESTHISKPSRKKKSLVRTWLQRWWASLSAHILILGAAYVTAFLLRFEFSFPNDVRSIMTASLPWILALKLGVFYKVGSFQARWRFVTLSDLALVIQAAVVSTFCIFAIDYFLLPQYQIPRVVLLLDWGVTILALGGVRSAPRLLHEHFRSRMVSNGKRPVLVIGAEAGGERLVREFRMNPSMKCRVAGFLDNDPSYKGSSIGGVPFLGTPDDAVSIADKHDVKEIVVITGSLPGKNLRSLVEVCREANIKVKMIPALDKLLNESYRLELRDVDINDLLRRDPIRLDTDCIAQMLKDRTVMVTGAGGSIGSEICRQIVKQSPKLLILVERAENSLFFIEQQLLATAPGVPLSPCLADVCDKQRLRRLFRELRPEVVFHAAAHKHVPLMERNAGEAVKNNVFGTKTIADVSDEFGVDRFIMISTDKAVQPTSVMGLSKCIAERCIYSLAQSSATKFVVVRFGNVLGSNGSVVPTFQEQIRRGGPVTVTHAEMRRFFMTIPEASQLVLQAATLGKGGEIFVLEMGEQVKILDLANDLIRLSGFERDEIEVEVVGIRPGEKLYEEICDVDERSLPTSHPKLSVVYPQPVDSSDVSRWLSELRPLVNAPESTIRAKLEQIVKTDAVPRDLEMGNAADVGRTLRGIDRANTVV